MDILERFHLALSYLEKSKAEMQNWERLRQTKEFDHSQYDLVKSRYERHIAQAQEITDTIQRGQKNSLPDLQEELRLIALRQRKLVKGVSEGKIDPKEANNQNRSITKDESRYQQILDIAQTISQTETTQDLGGQIDFSFEDFIEKLEIDESEIQPFVKPRPELKATNVAMLVLIGVIAWAVWNYYDALGKASWRTSVNDHKETLTIRCTNTGDKTIHIQAPWPDGNTTSNIPPKLQRMTFGILLYIREKGATKFQLLPESQGLWTKNAESHDSDISITVRPGERLDIGLEILELRKLGLNIEAVKVEFTRYNGRKVGGYELTVP